MTKDPALTCLEVLDLEAAIKVLRKRDKTLAKIIDRAGPFTFKANREHTPFRALVRSIIYQQLSGKAAGAIFKRFTALYKPKRFPKPEDVLKTADDRLRSAGLSRSKILALKDLSEKAQQGIVPTKRAIHKMTDQELIEQLITIRGIGQWSVEMLLIFHLGRADVFPSSDYGVRKGFAKFYTKGKLPAPKELLAFSERWKPHRTIAAWYMWRALEI